MGDRIPIPKQSADAFRKHQDKLCQNPGLIFDRFTLDWGGKPGVEKKEPGKVQSALRHQRSSQDRDREAKKNSLKAVQSAASNADAKLLKAWNARWEAMVRAIGAEPFQMTTDWRFVTGLGGGGPLEVGFTFHRYGFPILPGSSVKGIARAYASLYDGKDESDEDFRAIFGSLSQGSEDETGALCGGAVFFDAIPASLPSLELDIMNPHFPAYYQGKTAPTDNQNPVPVYFLTVAPGTAFLFAVGWRGALDDKTKALREQAETWLKEGLLWLGAGAKTSAGYGYFIEPTVAQDNSKGALATSTQPSPVQPTESALARRIRGLPQSQVKGSITNFATQWQKLPDGPEKVEVARALLEQMKNGGILSDKTWCEKGWVKEVREYCQAHPESNQENQE